MTPATGEKCPFCGAAMSFKANEDGELIPALGGGRVPSRRRRYRGRHLANL